MFFFLCSYTSTFEGGVQVTETVTVVLHGNGTDVKLLLPAPEVAEVSAAADASAVVWKFETGLPLAVDEELTRFVEAVSDVV